MVEKYGSDLELIAGLCGTDPRVFKYLKGAGRGAKDIINAFRLEGQNIEEAVKMINNICDNLKNSNFIRDTIAQESGIGSNHVNNFIYSLRCGDRNNALKTIFLIEGFNISKDLKIAWMELQIKIILLKKHYLN